MLEQPPHAKAWLRQRRSGEDALAAIADDELRHLGDAEALRLSDALLSATPRGANASRLASSGFVEQQHIFARARR